MLTVASSAFAAGKGSSMFSIGLGQNQANTVLTNPFGNKFDEINVGAQYQYMFSDDYAFALSGAFGKKIGGFIKKEWYDQLKKILTGQVDFALVGKEARLKIERNYTFNANKKKYLDFIENVRNSGNMV